MHKKEWGKNKVHSSIQQARLSRGHYGHSEVCNVEEGGWAFLRLKKLRLSGFRVLQVLVLIFLVQSFSSQVFSSPLLGIKQERQKELVEDALVHRNIHFNIPQQRADLALTLFAEQANLTLVFPFDDVKEKVANQLVGQYSLQEAATKLLAGTGLFPSFGNQLVLTITTEIMSGDEDMNRKKNILASTIAFFVGVGGVQGLAAEEVTGASSDNRLLEEVVVTAQKREERLIDVPISIVALSGETIKDAGIQNMSDLSFAVPNLSVYEKGPGQQMITIRGVGNLRGASSLIGLYLDEIPVSTIPLAQLDLQAIDLARVEVLRGPQGTLYGQGSVGGTVRFITNSPSFDGVDGSVGLSAYNTKKGDWSEEFTGVLNLPVIDDVLAFRVAASSKDKSGWLDQPGAGAKDINDEELSNIRLASLWQISDNTTIKATAIRHRNSGGGYNYANLGPVTDSNYQSAVDRTLTPSFSDEYDLYNLTLNHTFNFADLIIISSHIDSKKINKKDTQLLDLPSFSLTERLEQLFPILISNAKSSTQEIRLSSNKEEAVLSWSIGIFHSDLKTYVDLPEGASYALNEVFLFSIPVPSEDRFSKSIAYFGDISYNITDQLTAGIGTRYFEDQREGEFGGVKTAQADFNNLSSKLYLSFALNDGAVIYTSVSEGFRSGGHNSFSDSSLYEPEELISYEAGIKAGLFNGRLHTELVLFYSDNKNYQTTSLELTAGGATFSTLNTGTAEIQGIEWSSQWAATQQLSIGFSGNITDAEISETSRGVTTLNKGDSLDLVPENSYTFNVNYSFDWSSSVQGFVGLDYNYQGKASQTDRITGYAQEVIYSKSINLINFNVGALWGPLQATLFGQNLSDEDKLLTPSLSGQGPQHRPRTFGVRLNYDF